MRHLSRLIRLFWRIITLPIWLPYLIVKRFGRAIFRMMKALWKGLIWVVKKLWRFTFLYLKYIYWIQAKFIFYHLPKWLYRKILTPIGHGLKYMNTLLAHGIYRVLVHWFGERELGPVEEIEEPTPLLESKSQSHCQMCQTTTSHAVERVSPTSFDTSETCERCGSRQAGRWQEDANLLENYA